MSAFLASGETLAVEDAEMSNQTAGPGCPSFSEVPVAQMHEDKPEDDYFWAGRYYRGQGHDIPDLACNEDMVPTKDGYRHSSPPGSNIVMGSLMVLPGCTWYLFEDYDYEGEWMEFSGGNSGLLVSKLTNRWDRYCQIWGDNNEILAVPCFPSYLASCQQRFPNCVPKDGWQPITSLDNSQSNFEAPFTFQQTIGKF